MPIERAKEGSQEVYRLENRELSVSIAPGCGANVFRIKDKKLGHDLLRTPLNLQALIQEPVMWGIPILFPPNRIRNASFIFNDSLYQLPRNSPDGHHIHGLVLDKVWHFDSLSDDGDEMSISFKFDLMSDSQSAALFPHHLLFTYDLSLFERRLRMSLTIEHKGEGIAPIGIGFHTWFHLWGNLDAWKLKMPYHGIWALDESVMPTGEILKQDIPGLRSEGVVLSNSSFDTVFSLGSHNFVSTLEHESGYSIIYSGSRQFRHCVVHSARDEARYIAIEPYSWVTNAPNLSLPENVTGLIRLRPGNNLVLSTVIEITRS